MLGDVLGKIASPTDAGLRCAPFWAWNGELEIPELRRQIRIMKRMGMGGFFMHSRTGLSTPYLGKKWFDCVRACAEEAEKLGLLAWIYDEDRWPSGAAGGLATSDERFRQRRLRLLDAVPENGDGVAGMFAAVLIGEAAFRVRRISGADEVNPGETLLVFVAETVPAGGGWYNGQTYLDTMNPEAVAHFIEITHEKYRRETGRSFGRAIPGVFTDEPNYTSDASAPEFAPWTDKLPEEFRRRCGYDLIDHLPELFFHVDNRAVSQARRDYRNLCASLLTEAFSRTSGDWCRRNHLEFTGHVLMEDELNGQTACVGDAMRFYEYMDSPGIDLLTEHWGVFNTAKQVSSAARQFGRARRLTETNGCTGWDFPLFAHKALGDWQFALGINYRCPHLAWYTMRGDAKRDYPASIFFQSPWYRQYRTVEDYFARLSAACGEGEEARELLVMHPIESDWSVHTARDCAGLVRRDSDPGGIGFAFISFTNALLAANIDFDFGNEEIMSRHAAVENGRLRVGRASYSAVAVPPVVTLRPSTLKLLHDFAAAGGKVFLTFAPDGVSGTIGGCERFSIPAVSRAAGLVSIAGPDGRQIGPALHLLKRAADHDVLFVCNYGVKFKNAIQKYPRVIDRRLEFPQVDVEVKSRFRHVCELDASTGKRFRVTAENRNGVLKFRTSLARLGSRLFVFSDRKLGAARLEYGVPSGTLKLPEPAAVIPDEPNVMVLDHARFRIGREYCGRPEYFIEIDRRIREALGIPPRAQDGFQPWADPAAGTGKSVDIELEYRFNCRKTPVTECFLALEDPRCWNIELNGLRVPRRDRGWWVDPSLRKLALKPEIFRRGENVLKLRRRYVAGENGLESLFILGDFAVAANGAAMLRPVTALRFGDWVGQGFPNYSGNLTYRFEIVLKHACSGAKLRLGDWRGTAVLAAVNGRKPEIAAWPPWEIRLDGLVPGSNTVEITVLGHRRNSHGPFYCAETWPVWTGPGQFHRKHSSRRRLVPCGLLEPPAIELFY
ncbi:MAG: glycosyl hydrolase [Victivallaceae bacterium]|nr:glycosyl hydrolase [Victivallaceae bacterium]